MAATIDILPTLAAITESKLPGNTIDGVNIQSLMKGHFDTNPRDHFFFYYGRQLRAVRQGPWKLYFPHRSRSYKGVKPGNDGHPGPYAILQVGNELYNLERDISETKNVYQDYPDIVAKLESLAEKARKELGDRLTNRKGEGVREPGRKAWDRSKEVKHLAVNRNITLTIPPSPKYPGQGAKTLVNGKRGSLDYSDGQWLGFEGEDMEAVIDLGKMRPIRKVSSGFLRNQVSWIFLPESVEFALSEDNVNFKTIKYWEAKKAVDAAPLVKDYSVDIKSQSARYIRVKAKNRGQCPPWHTGAGSKAWIFIDEIIIR